MMREVMNVLEEKMECTVVKLQGMSVVERVGACQKGVELLGKKTKKNRVRWDDWMITTALRELREARTLANPSLKRAQQKPTRSSGQRAAKRKR
jgi:chemotaxis regulatin CheY-phosphate phosphatase CheZ